MYWVDLGAAEGESPEAPLQHNSLEGESPDAPVPRNSLEGVPPMSPYRIMERKGVLPLGDVLGDIHSLISYYKYNAKKREHVRRKV